MIPHFGVGSLTLTDKSMRDGLVIYAGDAIKPLADPEIWAVPSRRLFS